MKRTFEDLWRVFLKIQAIVSQFLFALERLAPRLVGNRPKPPGVPNGGPQSRGVPFRLQAGPHHVHPLGVLASFLHGPGGEQVPLFYIYGEVGATYGVINCGADRYFTLTPRIEDGLRRIGIAPQKMQRVPMVVHPHLLANGAPREYFKKRLGVPENDLLVILSLGGEGIGHSLRFVDAFVNGAEGATLMVLTGRNDDLLRELSARFESPKVVPMGYQEDISGIVAAADVLAGKCGTGYAMMAMKKGIPLIVTHIGAPNERENMRFIVDNGYGWFCPRPRQFVQRVGLLAQDRASCRDVMERLSQVGPQNGAEAIAEAIVSSLG